MFVTFLRKSGKDMICIIIRGKQEQDESLKAQLTVRRSLTFYRQVISESLVYRIIAVYATLNWIIVLGKMYFSCEIQMEPRPENSPRTG